MAEPARYALEPYFGEGRQELVGHVPHAHYLGIRVVRAGPCEAVLMIPYREELIGDPSRKVVFGGVVTTLLDQASGLAIACSVDVPKAIATIDLRVDYLRAAVPGRDLYGHAHCYKLTRNVAFVRGSAWDERQEDPFASFLATFMIGANTAESPYAELVRKAARGGQCT
ncbi:MAG: PaaI family thioesterase [Candidatus Dadabacteria bacterium]|nr:MAG: PaaI family thioesterase [Candidatus Dadabacteria bacterium]